MGDVKKIKISNEVKHFIGCVLIIIIMITGIKVCFPVSSTNSVSIDQMEKIEEYVIQPAGNSYIKYVPHMGEFSQWKLFINDDGYIKEDRLIVKNTKIIENDNIAPHVEVYKIKEKTAYIVYVPKGTIENGVSL